MENVLNSIGGVGMFGVISICLFLAVFAAVLVWTIRLKKPFLNSMRELPLEGRSAPEPKSEPSPNSKDRHD